MLHAIFFGPTGFGPAFNLLSKHLALFDRGVHSVAEVRLALRSPKRSSIAFRKSEPRAVHLLDDQAAVKHDLAALSVLNCLFCLIVAHLLCTALNGFACEVVDFGGL